MCSKEYVVPDFWEEHCVECGAPACYETCEKYQRGSGGLCKRFKKGIEIEQMNNGRERFKVHFLPWGKLELYWQGRLTSRRIASMIHRIYRLTSPLIRALFSEVVVRKVWRRLSQMLSRRNGQPNVWRIKCSAKSPTTLIISVVNCNKEELLVQRLDVYEEPVDHQIHLPKVKEKTCFRIASIEGSNSPVCFDCCELINVASKEISLTNNLDKPAQFVKCVAWDLDNTLWTGILADDGIDGVKLKTEVVSAIKILDKRGIVSTVCSKNNYDMAWKALEKFGLSEYFVFPQINWMPKSESLIRIAKEMNIGINSFAFVDDSFHERGEVSENLPCVRVFSEISINEILNGEAFNPPTSKQSFLRRHQYLLEMGRKKDEELYEGNHEDFLRRCDITLLCYVIKDEETGRRCWELINRTNQLTLAAHRYTNDEFNLFLQRYESYAIQCKDKYGDYGIIGFIAFSEEGDFVRLKEFVMSCRVAKKMCEQSVLLYFADKFKGVGKSKLVAKVVPTGRNGALIDSFDVMPFKKTYSDDINTLQFALDLQYCDWANVFRNTVELV